MTNLAHEVKLNEWLSQNMRRFSEQEINNLSTAFIYTQKRITKGVDDRFNPILFFRRTLKELVNHKREKGKNSKKEIYIIQSSANEDEEVQQQGCITEYALPLIDTKFDDVVEKLTVDQVIEDLKDYCKEEYDVLVSLLKTMKDSFTDNNVKFTLSQKITLARFTSDPVISDYIKEILECRGLEAL